MNISNLNIVDQRSLVITDRRYSSHTLKLESASVEASLDRELTPYEEAVSEIATSLYCDYETSESIISFEYATENGAAFVEFNKNIYLHDSAQIIADLYLGSKLATITFPLVRTYSVQNNFIERHEQSTLFCSDVKLVALTPEGWEYPYSLKVRW